MMTKKHPALMGIAFVLVFLFETCSCSRKADDADRWVDRDGGSVKPADSAGHGGQERSTEIAGQGGTIEASDQGGHGGTMEVAGRGGQGGTSEVAGQGGTEVAGQSGQGGTSEVAGQGGTEVAGQSGQGGAAETAGTGGASGASGDGGAGGTSEASCLDGITDYANDGPFTFDTGRYDRVNSWVPNLPAGCKVPMIHLATGTGAMCSTYSPSLERLASHGFLALCYESPTAGEGTPGIEAFEAGLSEYPDLADYKFGTTGHATGGQAAFVALQYAEEKWGDQGVYAGLAMQPDSGIGYAPWMEVYAKIKSPMFMFSGQGSDGLVSQTQVQAAFDALSDTVEAYHWAKAGLIHAIVTNSEEQQISIPWFRWKLLGDRRACQAFKAIPDDPVWIVAAVQNEQPCGDDDKAK